MDRRVVSAVVVFLSRFLVDLLLEMFSTLRCGLISNCHECVSEGCVWVSYNAKLIQRCMSPKSLQGDTEVVIGTQDGELCELLFPTPTTEVPELVQQLYDVQQSLAATRAWFGGGLSVLAVGFLFLVFGVLCYFKRFLMNGDDDNNNSNNNRRHRRNTRRERSVMRDRSFSPPNDRHSPLQMSMQDFLRQQTPCPAAVATSASAAAVTTNPAPPLAIMPASAAAVITTNPPPPLAIMPAAAAAENTAAVPPTTPTNALLRAAVAQEEVQGWVADWQLSVCDGSGNAGEAVELIDFRTSASPPASPTTHTAITMDN